MKETLNNIGKAISLLPEKNEDLRKIKEALGFDSLKLAKEMQSDALSVIEVDAIVDRMATNLAEYAEKSQAINNYIPKLANNVIQLLTELRHSHYITHLESKLAAAAMIKIYLNRIKNPVLKAILMEKLGKETAEELPEKSLVEKFVISLNNEEKKQGHPLNYNEYQKLRETYDAELGKEEKFGDMLLMGTVFTLGPRDFQTKPSKKIAENAKPLHKKALESLQKTVAVFSKRAGASLAVNIREMSLDAKTFADKSIREIAQAIIENPAIADEFMKKTPDKKLQSGLARNYRKEFAKAYTSIRDMIIEGDAMLLNAILVNNLLETHHLDLKDKKNLEVSLINRLKDNPELMHQIINYSSAPLDIGVRQSLQKMSADVGLPLPRAEAPLSIADLVIRNPNIAEKVLKNKDNQRMLINNPGLIKKMVQSGNQKVLRALDFSGLIDRMDFSAQTEITAEWIGKIDNGVLRTTLLKNLYEPTITNLYDKLPTPQEMENLIKNINNALSSPKGLTRKVYLQIRNDIFLNDTFPKKDFAYLLDIPNEYFKSSTGLLNKPMRALSSTKADKEEGSDSEKPGESTKSMRDTK